MRSEQIDDARRQLAEWMSNWRLPLAIVNNAAVHLVDIGAISQFVASQLMYAAEERVLEQVAAQGARRTTTDRRVTVDEVNRYALIEATLVASARRTVFDQLIAAGRVPPGAEPPPAVQVTSADPMELDRTRCATGRTGRDR